MAITTPIQPDGRKDGWTDRRVDVQIDGRKAVGKDAPGAFVIVLANHKGGVTKTTSTANLAAMLAEAGRRVLIVDCDPQANLSEKGDPEDVEHMKQLAARARVPFVLLDSQDPDTDRWQPLWGSPDGVAARAVEAIKQSEPYYYDVLRATSTWSARRCTPRGCGHRRSLC
jgi:signal recognition particle GTPase